MDATDISRQRTRLASLFLGALAEKQLGATILWTTF